MSNNKKKKVMVVGAHAADAEIMAGAVVANYTKAGHESVLVHMTPGERGHKTMSAEKYAEQKKKEAKQAAEILGAGCVFLPYEDGELPVNDEVKFALCDIIREEKPDILITHWKGSIHKDHENTSYIVKDALFFAALPSIKREKPAHYCKKLYYAENWEDPKGFEVDTYIDITGSYDTWLKASEEYELFSGNISDFRYLDYYKALAVMRGCLGGFNYAVGLMRPEDDKIIKGEYLD